MYSLQKPPYNLREIRETTYSVYVASVVGIAEQIKSWTAKVFEKHIAYVDLRETVSSVICAHLQVPKRRSRGQWIS